MHFRLNVMKMSRIIHPMRNIIRNVTTDLAYQPKVITYQQSLLNIPQTKVSIAENTMRVASEESDKPTATVGVFIAAGSRYESPNMNGVANFFEHMAFKGTNKRSFTDLEHEINNMGAQVSAHTARDHTVFYAKCLKEEVPHAVEILSDIIQNSKFDEAAVEKERAVILNEIEESSNDLTQVAYDYLHTIAFADTSLCQPVGGRTENIRAINKLDIDDYRNVHYKPGRMVLAGAGGVNHEQLVELASKHFNSLPGNMEGNTPEPGRPVFTGGELLVRNDDMPLSHCTMAFETVGRSDPSHLPLHLAGLLIGMWDKSHGGVGHNASKLAEILFKNDYGHAFQNFNIVYEDTGLWGNYFVVERLQQFDFVFHLTEEIVRIATRASDFEVQRAKNNYRTNMLVQLDGPTAICEDIGKQVLFDNKRTTLSEIDTQLDAITASDVRKACMTYIYDREIAIAAVGAIEQLPDLSSFMARNYKFLV